MSPVQRSMTGLNLPAFLEEKCQGLLDDILRADSLNAALLYEQRAAGFTEALECLQVIPREQIEQLYERYERAMTWRIAELRT